MKAYEYLLFDLDNTLLDFTKAEEEAFKVTTSKLGIEFSTEVYRKYSQINDGLWKQLEKKEITLDFLKIERFRLLLVSLGYPQEDETVRVAGDMRDCYISALAEQTFMIDGADEVLRALSARYKIYIVTNGISKIQRSRISRSSISDLVSDIFISEEMGCAKPSAEYFGAVLCKIGDSDRSKYLVIGDSLSSDCDGAIGYGLDICRYNPGALSDNGRKLTYNVKRLSELTGILLGE